MRRTRSGHALRTIGLSTLALTATASCEPYRPTQHSDEFKGSWGRAVQMLAERTPHDLNCPLEEQTFKDLSGRGGLSGGTTVGVSGCGSRATYQFVNGTWIADIAGTNSAPAMENSPADPGDSADQ